jgi:hypothetical protein
VNAADAVATKDREARVESSDAFSRRGVCDFYCTGASAGCNESLEDENENEDKEL